MRIALFFSLAFLTVATTASAGPRLQWSVDTIHVVQRGCSMHTDSFIVTITNVGDSIETLRSVNGHSDRWKIAGYDTLKEIDMLPGDSKDVKIYFTAYRTGYSTDRAISRTQSRTEDTIYLITDVFVSSLGLGDTNRVPASEFKQGDSVVASYAFYVNGNTPFVIKNMTVSGDPQVSLTVEPASDTLTSTSPFYLHCVVRPNEVKTYSATIAIQGTECETVFSKTVLFPILVRSGVRDRAIDKNLLLNLHDRMLTVSGAEEGSYYEIVGAAGVTMRTGDILTGRSIDLHGLSAGAYFLRIGGRTSKFAIL